MDIKQALKERIKALKTELAANEKALAALTGDAAPKASKAPRTTGSSASSTKQPESTGTSPTTPGNLPDRIIAYTTTNGLKSVDELVEALGAPKGQVATTCSRMVRKGKLEKIERSSDGVTAYLAVHEPAGAPPPKDVNPFAGETN